MRRHEQVQSFAVLYSRFVMIVNILIVYGRVLRLAFAPFQSTRQFNGPASPTTTLSNDRQGRLSLPELITSSVSNPTTVNPRSSAVAILSDTPELRHLFFISCDSHGLQLLIKDFLVAMKTKRGHTPTVSTAIQKHFILAYRIMVAFQKAPLQCVILRTKRIDAWGKEIALIPSVMTRWGTQFRALMSLSNNMRALQCHHRLGF